MPGDRSTAGIPSGHGSQPGIRASHADRDQVADQLSIAAGEGRLTTEELGQRLEAALSARTIGELTELTADLPPASVFPGGVLAAAKDVLRIEQRFSPVKRAGRWVVPRRLELAVEFCEVTLDFTQAVITQDTVQIDLDMRGKTLTLIVGPGIVVDTDGLCLEFSKVKNRQTPDRDTPIALRVELTGTKRFGRVVVRQPRRTTGR
ncbi:hypothetical protein GCM10018790_49680 [Kitasatospora xanthocidica]|uniref:DUF1707 SHOCT-like domain-containing protein n=1 Tax=Kitasatospora xanthocidica TaxID=83382 RepID=UPI001673BD4E|nr:DUF1707 domain-containing protein [Kitasatospora xanthocidica]GHF65928.1 hypothetical protein GCM10018790_49680 [Kitasatospora xanthocidica]